MELKTSTHGVTKTAQIKTGFSNVNDYSKYLQEKYSYMNTGKNINVWYSNNGNCIKCLSKEVHE